MVHSFIRTKQRPRYIDKFIYYLKCEEINYYFNGHDILLYINKDTHLTIILNQQISVSSNNKSLFKLIDKINTDTSNSLFLQRIEDVVYLIVNHIKINKKIKKTELENTLCDLKYMYISTINNYTSYDYWKLFMINNSIKQIFENSLHKIYSLIEYPIIEIVQNHIIDEKHVAIYIKYNYFTENPLSLKIECTDDFKYDLFEKIEKLNIFKNWNTWKEQYILCFINDKIFDIIKKYGKLQKLYNNKSLDFLIEDVEDEMNFNNNVNEELLTKEFDYCIVLTKNIKTNEIYLENQKIKIYTKIEKLFFHLSNIDYITNTLNITKIKIIINNYLENYYGSDAIVYTLIDFVIVNLKMFNNIHTDDCQTINNVNKFLFNNNMPYKIEHLIQNTNDINNNGQYKINMKNNAILECYKKRKKHSTSNLIIDEDNLEEIPLSSDNDDDDDDNECQNKKRGKKNKIINSDNNLTIEIPKTYCDIFDKHKITYCDMFNNFKLSSSALLISQRKQLNNEIKILKKNIIINDKSGMFVCCNNIHPGIIRFMLTGPYGTPYENGLFIFDLSINKNFPNKPPDVLFSNNGGVRFNPNLYNCGKVCLSLLGTWPGDDVEQWNPKVSNIFQILISIQSLILVDEPYFNEPGYMNTYGETEAMNDSNEYNKKIRLHTINHGINDLLNDLESDTPNYPEFHDVIREHFKYKKNEILIKINEWSNMLDPVASTTHTIYQHKYTYKTIFDESIKKYKKLIKYW
jgi:ubiquitin-protein ligase